MNICTVSDCGKPTVGRGYCRTHYNRWHTHGDPLHERAKIPTCYVPDCNRPTSSKTTSGGLGLCSAHYRRMKRHGDPLAGGAFQKPPRSCSVDGCNNRQKARDLCPGHYMRWKKYGDPSVVRGRSRRPAPAVDRFWAQVEFSDCCWVWVGALSHGYGTFGNGEGRNVGAHRWAYEFCVAPIPPELSPDHLCFNKACVRPDHIELVTPEVNSMRGGWRGGHPTHKKSL